MKSVILCGGSGTRLWPMSREAFPKQFVPLIEGKSLLEETIKRVRFLGELVCVANHEHRFLVLEALKSQLGQDDKSSAIILEPVARNTAAAMAAAALMPDVLPDDLLLFLPSDHYIPDAQKFVKTIDSGKALAQQGYIVTFGVQPTHPSVGYGYIEKGDKLNSHGYRVDRFIEKPALNECEKMLMSGDFYWNAGIFLCKANVLLHALKLHAEDILISVRLAMAKHTVDDIFFRPNKDIFSECRAESIDYAVMEFFDKVAVVPFEGVWSDVGSWSAVAQFTPADMSSNRILGHGVAINTVNTYINAPDRPVVALGVGDLIIVDTPDAVLVSSASQTELVKDVVNNLKQANISQALEHRRVVRPWGWYDSIDSGNSFLVKRITVKSGASISLQVHNYRSEHWIVVQGRARVTNGAEVFFLEENQSTYIPRGVIHRLENLEKNYLEMIEVQTGSYLSEDDIVRIEDVYGR